MNNFKNHYSKFNKNGEPVKRRHMSDTVGVTNATNPHMKHASKIVPDSHKADNNAVQEFEQLKKLPKGTKTINLQKAQKLKTQFNLSSFAGMLGNTGIQLAQHHEPGFFVLIKQ